MDIPSVKISLFEFAKNVTGGIDPTSVRIIDPQTGEEVKQFMFFGEGDFLPSVKFSQNDFFEDLTETQESKPGVGKLETSIFPGLI